MLLVIIASIAAFIITMIVIGIDERGVDLGVVACSLFVTILALVGSLVIAGILSIFQSNTVESERIIYPIVENRVGDDLYYVNERHPEDHVDYDFSYLDEDNTIQKVYTSGDAVIINIEKSKEPTVTRVTKTIPDGWKPWCIWKDAYIYEITIPSMEYMRSE